MGMICTLRRISKAKLDEYLENSHLMEEEFFSNEVTEIPLLDIDKSWDGIIFLLTGATFNEASENERALIIIGEKPMSTRPDSQDYHARYNSPEKVLHFAEILKSIDPNDLKSKFNPKRMNELDVYPNIWEQEDKNELFTYLEEYFLKIQNFYQQAAWSKEAIVIEIA